MMNALFYITVIFVGTLGISVVTGYEFHETASIVALFISGVAWVLGALNALDIHKMSKKGTTDDRSDS